MTAQTHEHFQGFPMLPRRDAPGMYLPPHLHVPPSVYLRTDEEALRAVRIFDGARIVGLDTETTGLRWSMGDRPLFVSLARFSGKITEVPDPSSAVPDGFRVAFPIRLLRHFRHILEDASITKVLTNAKFDMHQLAMHSGIRLAGTVLDTVYLSFLYDENAHNHKLKPGAYKHLGMKMRKFDFKNMRPFYDILEMHDVRGKEAEAERLAHQLYLSMREMELLDAAKSAKLASPYDRQHPMYTTQAADDDDDDDVEDDLNLIQRVQSKQQSTRANVSQVGMGFVPDGAAPVHLDAEGNAAVGIDVLMATRYLRAAREDEQDIDELTCLRFLLKCNANRTHGILTGTDLVRQMARRLGLTPSFSGRACHAAEILYIHSAGTIDLPRVDERTQAYIDLAESYEVHTRVIDIVYEAALAYHKRRHMIGSAVDEVRREIQEYASLDAWASLALGRFFIRSLADTSTSSVTPAPGVPYKSLWGIMQSRCAVMTKVLWCMEGRGVTYDADMSAELAKTLGGAADEALRVLTIAMSERLKRPGNLNSVNDLRRFLFEFDEETGNWYDLDDYPDGTPLSGDRMGKSGPTTNKRVLQHLTDGGNTSAKLITQYRAMTKLVSTYVGALPKYISPTTGRIHTDFRQHAAVTGRLSSTSPALLNIPTKGEHGQTIRRAFKAGRWGDVKCREVYCLDAVADIPLPNLPPDTPMILTVGDYSAAELVVLAHLSGDANMIAAIENNRDLHCTTVNYAYPGKYSYEEILAAHKAPKLGASDRVLKLKKLRDCMKIAIFGMIYGIGPVSLGRQLGFRIIRRRDQRTGRLREECPEAEEVMDRVFTAYPSVKGWIEEVQAYARAHGYITTISGRRRRLPDARGKGSARFRAMRQGPNAAIQGSVFDLIQDAMIRIENDPELRRRGFQLLLQVHDELLGEYPDIPGNKEFIEQRLAEHMSNHVFRMRVAPKATFDSAMNWAAAKG